MSENNKFDFNDFTGFTAFIAKEGMSIKNWSMGRFQAFAEKVRELIETDPVFKAKYEEWNKKLEEKVAKKAPDTAKMKDNKKTSPAKKKHPLAIPLEAAPYGKEEQRKAENAFKLSAQKRQKRIKEKEERQKQSGIEIIKIKKKQFEI